MECERLECSFICVDPVCLTDDPVSNNVITSSRLSHVTSLAPLITESHKGIGKTTFIDV